MKPQTQPASSPPRSTANSAARRVATSAKLAPTPTRPAPARTPGQKVEDVDFYSLRQTRIREENERAAQLRLVPTEAPVEVEADPLSPIENEQFERLVKSKTAKSKAVRTRRAKVPCAPCHWGLLMAAMLLTALSIPLVYSASTAIALDQHGGNPDFFLSRQIGFALAGFAVMISASRLSPAKVRGWSWIFYAVAVLGLVLTKFSPLGTSMGNTERWVKLGPITLQFSELAKIALIGVMADFWSRASRDSQRSMWPWLAAAVLGGIPIALTFIQPHLSATLVLFAVALSIAFFAGAPMRHFGWIFGTLIAGGLLAISLCKAGTMPLIAPYQQARIASHFSAADKTAGKTSQYQQDQGKRALMRGGVKGRGVGASLYKQGHLPAPHTDFIYAVIGEEWGLLGTLGLLAIYGSVVFFCFQIGHSAVRSFDSLLCAGVGTLLGVQAAGNIGVVSGLLPVTGMPLPFLTYGGSGLICALLGVGLVLAISRAQCEGNSGQEKAEG
ncbi:MAG TPA: putative peptidoglycan glycosyltransferase FtsW [Abditibacterium sp.]|jgi:cell division protein FtsW